MAKQAVYDVLVIGGGASGLAAAIAAAQEGASVAIAEMDVDLGLPILATGNGRCNLSNVNLAPEHYRHPQVAQTVMGANPEAELAEFFDYAGIWTTRIETRLYPRSLRAESVRDALINTCERLGVTSYVGCRFGSFSYYAAKHALTDVHDNRWHFDLDVPASHLYEPGLDGPVGAPIDQKAFRKMRRNLEKVNRKIVEVRASKVILACGQGGQELVEAFNLPYAAQTPVLCPLNCTISPLRILRALDGLRVNATINILADRSHSFGEKGEILFRSYGLSGIAAFNVSRRVAAGSRIEIDLFPDMDEAKLTDAFRQREKTHGALGSDVVSDSTWFDGILAPELAQALFTLAGASDAQTLAHCAKHIPLTVTGLSEHSVAQAHRGGIPFDALYLPSLLAKDYVTQNVYACGEVLDMDADCGGYNLAWAWLSGIRAGKAAAQAN